MKTLALAVFLSLSAASYAQDIPAMPTPVISTEDGGTVAVAVPVAPHLTPTTGDDSAFYVETAKAIVTAVKTKAWGHLIFLVITVLVIFTRKFLAPKVAFFRGKFGPPLLAFLWAGAGALATTWAAGTKFNPASLWTVFIAGITAAGGWSLLKAVLEHFSPKEEGKTNWATTLLDFFSPKPPAQTPVP